MDKNKKGFSYLEIIIGIAIFGIIIHAFFTLITTTYRFIGLSRSQATARALSNQQIETIRNLPYDQVGTQGGIPAGPILQTQTRIINNQTYTIKTSIIYIDDPFDGTVPSDLLPTDYKKIRVKTTWNGPFTNSEGITLLTNIVPKGVESIVGGGTLAILVFDSTGQPIPQADIIIKTTTTSPPIDLNLFTDNDGNLILPGAPICTSCYQITVSKNNYSTDKTISTSEVANPNTPFQTVLENQLTQVSFAIDKISNTTFQTLSYPNQNPLPNSQLQITGQKTLGTDVNGDPVYKYSQSVTTDSNGRLTLNLEWDTYQIINLNGDLVAGTNPLLPITIIPNETKEIKITSIAPPPHSLSTLVKDASGTAIASAEAKLTNSSGFEEINFTGSENDGFYGYTFFQVPTLGSYTLEVAAPNYEISTNSATINGNIFQSIVLNHQ